MGTKRGFNIEEHEAATDTAAAEGVASDRFSRARQIVAEQPSGISAPPVTASKPSPAAPAESGAAGPVITTTDNVVDNAFNARHASSRKNFVPGHFSASMLRERGRIIL